MPKIARWENFPEASGSDTNPQVLEDDWYKDFGSFKICGRGPLAKTFLLRGQAAKGEKL